MSLCTFCGLNDETDHAFHEYHTVTAQEWAIGNRILCDLIHRGRVPPRLQPHERDEDFWANAP